MVESPQIARVSGVLPRTVLVGRSVRYVTSLGARRISYVSGYVDQRDRRGAVGVLRFA